MCGSIPPITIPPPPRDFCVQNQGNYLFLHVWGWGIDHPVRKKGQIPRGMPGGMVTGGIIHT